MPISPQADYCLQGAVCCLHLTPDLFHAIHIGNLDIERFLSAPGAPGDFAKDIEQVALAWWTDASQRDRTCAAARGLASIQWQIDEFIEAVKNALILEYVQAQDVALPWISREVPRLPLAADGSHEDAVDCVMQTSDALVTWLQKFRDQHERLKDVLHQPNAATYWREVNVNANYYPLTNPPKTAARAAVRKARRVINRGIRAYSRTFGIADIRQFISQHKLTIQGQRYDYALTNLGNIVKHTINMTDGAPFAIGIRTKAGQPLAVACIYIPNTPVLDQLLALALNVRHAESEREFLHAATLSKVPEIEEGDAVNELWAYADKPDRSYIPNQDWGDGAPVNSPDEVNAFWQRSGLIERYRRVRSEAFELYARVLPPIVERRIAESSGVPLDIITVMRCPDFERSLMRTMLDTLIDG